MDERKSLAELRRDVIAAGLVIIVVAAGAFIIHWML
jgi:hypothetical protein